MFQKIYPVPSAEFDEGRFQGMAFVLIHLGRESNIDPEPPDPRVHYPGFASG
jgi:hypothetical protein